MSKVQLDADTGSALNIADRLLKVKAGTGGSGRGMIQEDGPSIQRALLIHRERRVGNGKSAEQRDAVHPLCEYFRNVLWRVASLLSVHIKEIRSSSVARGYKQYALL